MSRIERRFVRVGDRDVHVRIAGAGPAVLLVHQSPQSSAALLPMIEALADGHLVIAPDTPGFGHSEPMGRAQPTIDDFASNLAALLAVLGLEPVAAWGVHTGASIATRLALLAPARVALLVTDGLARFTEAERRPMLARYLPPFEPAWDGTHLLWLWARFREQLLYFPWNDDRAECRLAFDLPTPERTQRDVLDALAAGDGFRTGYRAPFLLDDPEGPGRLTVSAHLLYRRDDVLYPHADRLPPLPPNVAVERIESGQAGMLARLRELLAAHRGRCALVAGAPSGALHPTGAHLIEAWNWVRLGALFPRWWPPLGRHARRVAAPAPFLVEEDAVEVIRLGARLAPMLEAHLAPSLESLAAGLGPRLVLRAPAGFELADRLAALAQSLGARLVPSPSTGAQP